MRQFRIGVLLLAYAGTAMAGDKLVTIDTRPGVTVSFYYMKPAGARATLVLLPGGGGGIGKKDGVPTSDNFLVRTRDDFAAAGFNVAVVERPSDKIELDYEFRASRQHADDLRRVVAYVKRDAGVPVWLVGTSRGTVSATTAAIAFGNDELAGLVLTSSVTNVKKTGAVPAQKLGGIRIPVLVMHHARDACVACRPREVALIMSGLTNAPIKKQIMVNAGANPRGDECGALHWHGYVGMEKEAVARITDWIKTPSSD